MAKYTFEFGGHAPSSMYTKAAKAEAPEMPRGMLK
jgi:hypothetical protein